MPSVEPPPSSGNSTGQGHRRRHRTRPKKKPANDSEQGATDDASGSQHANGAESRNNNNNGNNHSSTSGRPNQRVKRADPSRVVRKPQQANPQRLSKRDQEIAQLQRAFPSLKEDDHDPTKFRMQLVPSDPDFPFDIQSLDFYIYIPMNYPSRTNPQHQSSSRAPPPTVFPMIVVQNEDIPKGFSVNIDMGFKMLAEAYAQNGMTLLDTIIALDRELENFLRQEKRETIRLVRMNNKKPKASSSLSSQVISEHDGSEPTAKFALDSAPPVFIPPATRKERQSQIDKLKHSLGSSSMWTISSDKSEDVYGITVTCKNPTELPSEMNGDLTFNLHVPSSYGLSEQCFIIFPAHIDDFPSAVVENNFNTFARAHKDWKLFSLVNYLACRVGDLVTEDFEIEEVSTPAPIALKPSSIDKAVDTQPQSDTTSAEVQDKARKILSSLLKKPSDTADSTSDGDSAEPQQKDGNVDEDEEYLEEESETEQDNIFNLEPLKPRGIALQVPSLAMTNVGILECTTINLVVLCDRCGTQNDLFNIVSGPYGRESKPIASSCSKCKAVLACSFQKNLVNLHMPGTPTAGYLDMSGCTPMDLLGSTFVATCENCTSSNQDAPFKRLEGKRAATVNCRSCHIRMTLQLGEDGYRFETVTDDKLSEERLKGVRVKKVDSGKQKLGLSSGQPLPDDGKCTHFRKSTRWYRFSCCGKVFPCDKCHDQESNHPFEHGTRIICGKCSREQNFANTCSYCQHKFDNRGNTGFWEGGKGTRDPTKLNRNDRRKYKKLGKNQKSN